MIIEVTGATTYHGFLPTLVRECVVAITSAGEYRRVLDTTLPFPLPSLPLTHFFVCAYNTFMYTLNFNKKLCEIESITSCVYQSHLYMYFTHNKHYFTHQTKLMPNIDFVLIHTCTCILYMYNGMLIILYNIMLYMYIVYSLYVSYCMYYRS